MKEEKKTAPEREEERIHALIDKLYAPYFEDNYDEPWYLGEEPTDDQEWKIEEALSKAVGEKFTYVGSARGEISGAGIGWSVDTSFYMWPEVLEDGRTWTIYALWFDDNWNKWQFNESGSIELEGGSFEKATYELLKEAMPDMDDDEDNARVNRDVERWRRLSLGLPERPRVLGPFVERTHRNHDPYRWTCEAQFGFEEFNVLDWPALSRLGYAVAKADQTLHPSEDRKLIRWWEEATREMSSWMGIKPQAMSKVLKEWDEEPSLDAELHAQLEAMPKDKRIRFCQLLHAMADADGKVVEAEMDLVRELAKVLRVNLMDEGSYIGNRGALRDFHRMKGAIGDVSALRAFCPTWLYLPLPVLPLAPLAGLKVLEADVRRNEMAVAWLAMAFKPGYRLTLILGSDSEGQYLRAEDSLEVTWPERRISLRARTEELIDFLAGQEGYIAAYPHKDAHDPDRFPVTTPLEWMLGKVNPDTVGHERNFRGMSALNLTCEAPKTEPESEMAQFAAAELAKCRESSASGGRVQVLISSEFWPLAESLALFLSGKW